MRSCIQLLEKTPRERQNPSTHKFKLDTYFIPSSDISRCKSTTLTHQHWSLSDCCPIVVRLLSDCCSISERTTSGQRADNDWTTTSVDTKKNRTDYGIFTVFCPACNVSDSAYLFLRWQSLGVTQVPLARQTRIFSSSTSAALSLMSGRVFITL